MQNYVVVFDMLFNLNHMYRRLPKYVTFEQMPSLLHNPQLLTWVL